MSRRAVRRTGRGRALLLLATLALALLACGEGDDATTLTDPAELLERSIDRAAETAAVHVRFDLEAPAMPAIDGAAGEGDVDLADRDLAATIDLPAAGSDVHLDVRYVDSGLFTRTGDGPWARWGGATAADPLALLPTTAKIADLLGTALDDPAVGVELVGAERCGDAACRHVRVTIPPDVVWQMSQRLAGLDGLGDPAPPGIDPLPFEAWVDAEDLDLVRASFSVPYGAEPIGVTVELSRHDEPVDVEPPPSDEIAEE